MRETDLFENLEPAVLPERHRGANEVTETVQGADGGLLKWRNEEGAGQVRRMVLDVVDLWELFHSDGKGIRQRSLEVLELSKIAEPISKESPRGAVAEDEGGFPQEVRLWISADGDRVDVFAFDSTDLEAAADRCGGEAGIVLDAAEALFLERGDELAVADEDCRDVGVVDVDAENVHGFSVRNATTTNSCLRTLAIGGVAVLIG